jgi:hypothetical protein
MGIEELITFNVRTVQKMRMKRETYLMGEEEKVKSIYEFLDLNIQEVIDSKNAVDKAVNLSYDVTLTKKFARIQKDTQKAATNQWLANLTMKAKGYDGPPSG